MYKNLEGIEDWKGEMKRRQNNNTKKIHLQYIFRAVYENCLATDAIYVLFIYVLKIIN